MNTPNNQKKILIVNYDAELTDSLRLFLCKKGYVVYTASVIEQIFEIAFKKRKTIEYILLEAEHLDGTNLSQAGFKITEQSLENLKSEGVPDAVLEELQSLKNTKFIGEEKFLDILKRTIEDEQTVRFKSLILKHAEKHPVLDALSFWQALFRECCLPLFKLVMFQPRDIPNLVQKLNQEGKQLCQRNLDNLNDVVKLMKAQLAKKQLCELQLAKKIENSIQEKHRILEHGKQPANLAPMTKDARYLFYALAMCFQIRHRLRFLILDNAWSRKNNLKDMFDRLGIHTGVVGVSESENLNPPNDPANYTYFVDFEDFNKKKGLDVRRENWEEDIRKIFNPSLPNQRQHFCFDGIVLDIFLIDEDDETENNKYDGIDILQALKNDNKYHQREGGLDNIPIIMLTALGDEWHIIESINKKADWYIPKYKYDNKLIESIKDIPVAFYRLYYLKRRELQKLFIKIFKIVCDIEKNLKNHKKIKRKRLDRLQEGLKEFRQGDIPSFLSPFFESLDKIANKCKFIIDPGLEQEDWVEVKDSGEAILDELDKISRFNNVCCFENCEKYQEYLKQRELQGELQGRDRASLPFISGKLTSEGKSEQPSLLSKHVHNKVIDIIKSANAHIRRLPIQRPPEIV